MRSNRVADDNCGVRTVLGLVVLSACGFQISGSKPASDAEPMIEDAMVAEDAMADVDAPPIDAPIDAAVTIDASLCGVMPGSSITVSQTQGWEISTNGTTWTAVTLPSTNWPCDNCTRYFRTTVCGQPETVKFQFASDNRARMSINGTVAYDEYWIAGYCTDQPCCTKCCDSTANCTASLSSEKTLAPQGLALFTATTTNTVVWEVREEGGGSGFLAQMTIGY